MSDFYDLIDEYLGDADALTDIRVVVRRLWFYDFDGYSLRIWQGKGRLFTSDGNVWLGTIAQNNVDQHGAPALQDGRDGSSGTYEFSLNIVDLPGEPALKLYQEIKADQWRVFGRNLTCYLAVFKQGENLRPVTPIVFFKQLTMMSPKFTEGLQGNSDGSLTRTYKATVLAKDANYGRTNTPNGTYADTCQKQRALELGVSVDKGSEYLGALANRTYTIP